MKWRSYLAGTRRSLIFLGIALLISGCADEADTSSDSPKQQMDSNSNTKSAYPKLQSWKALKAREPLSDWSETIARACNSATFNAIQDIRDYGAIVETTGEEYVVRNARCIPVALDEGVWGCTFEHATTLPFANPPEEAKDIQDGRWEQNFQLMYYGREDGTEEPYHYRWRVSDTCEPFVFDIGGMEIDPREMMSEDIQDYLISNLKVQQSSP